MYCKPMISAVNHLPDGNPTARYSVAMTNRVANHLPKEPLALEYTEEVPKRDTAVHAYTTSDKSSVCCE